MAVRPDYTTGTLTLVADSVNFTTTGSALQTIAGVREGDKLITASGHVLKIATITGDNAGTLAYVCPAAAAGAAQPLRIEFQPDGARYSAKTAQLIELLGDGNLQSLAGLDGVANRFPFFNSPSTLDLATVTPFARSLLDDLDAAAAQGTLGYTAADVLAKLVSVNGAASAYATPNNDEFAGYPTGVSYSQVPAATGFPTNLTTILTVKAGTNRTFQIGFGTSGNLAMYRAQHVSNPGTNGWSTWGNIPTMDYEEGSWTPGIAFGGASTGIAYSARAGIYTRLGRLIVAPYNLSLTSKGTATGNATLTGLPFTQAAGVFSSGIVGYYTGMTGVVGTLNHTTEGGGTFFRMGGDAASGTLSNGNFSATTVVRATAIYHI